MRWRPHKELCFDWSAGLSTGVFPSIRANVRPPSSQWIPNKLTSNTTSSYLAPASVSTPLQLFSGSPSTALFPFSKHVSSLKAKFFRRLKALRCISAYSWGPSNESLSVLYNLFFGLFSLTLHPDGFLSQALPISPNWSLGLKPRLYRSSWRAFASTHPLMFPSTSSREALVACPSFSPWNLPSLTVESTLSTPCSCSDPPHSRQGAALAHLDYPLS